MLKRWGAAIAGAAIIFCAAQAHAEWMTTVEDDIFSGGQKATLLGLISLSSSIVADCTAGGELSLSYVEKGEWQPGMELLKFKLLLKVGGNHVLEMDATAAPRNADYFEVKSQDEDKILVALYSIKDTRQKAVIGLSEPTSDMKFSATVQPGGSAKAITKFLTACKIGK